MKAKRRDLLRAPRLGTNYRGTSALEQNLALPTHCSVALPLAVVDPNGRHATIILKGENWNLLVVIT